MADDATAVSGLCSVAILLIALLSLKLGGSWRHPAAVFSGLWFLTSTPSLLAIPEEVRSEGMIVILLFALAVVAGAELGRALFRRELRGVMGEGGDVSNNRRAVSALGIVVSVLAACGFGASLLYLGEGQVTFTGLLTFEGWLENAAYFSLARYFEGYVEPVPIRILSALNYAGALLGGVLMAVSRQRSHRVIAVFPVVFGIVITIITTAKTGSLMCVLFFLSAYVAMTCTGGRRPARALAPLVVAGFATLGGLSVLSLLLRYGPEDSFAAGFIGERVASYLFGHMAAFSAWLNWDGVVSTGPLFGLRSFAGIAEVLGLTQRIPGLYTAIPVGTIAEGTNVFTAFRGLIEDFTLPGGFAVMGIFALGAGYAFEQLRSGFYGPVAVLTLVGFYAFVGWSPVVSVFMYNVVLLAFAFLGAVLLLLRRELNEPPTTSSGFVPENRWHSAGKVREP